MKHNPTWIQLANPYNSKLHEVQLQQYHAAQFLALVGKYSNTTGRVLNNLLTLLVFQWVEIYLYKKTYRNE